MTHIKPYLITSMTMNIQERKLKTGKVYDAVFRVIDSYTGETKQKRLSGYPTKQAAKQAHAEFIKEECELVKSNPFDNSITVKREKTVPTVKELSIEYLGSLTNQNKVSSIYDKKSAFNNHILPAVGDLKMTELTEQALYKWQDDLWSKPNPCREGYYSYARLKHIRAVFNSFLNWSEQRYKYKNNLKTVVIPKRRDQQLKTTKDNFWTEEQFKKFISYVDDPLYKAYFSFSFYTGKRQGEVLALSPKDFKDNFSKVLINKSVSQKTSNGQPWQVTTTKAYKTDLLPLSPAAQRALKEYSKTEYYDPDSDFIFGKTRPLHLESVRHTFEKYIKLSGVQRITLHGLRHSFVSLIIHHGGNLTVVADLINDTLEQVTKTYAHMYDIDKISVLNSIT